MIPIDYTDCVNNYVSSNKINTDDIAELEKMVHHCAIRDYTHILYGNLNIYKTAFRNAHDTCSKRLNSCMNECIIEDKNKFDCLKGWNHCVDSQFNKNLK